MNLPNFFIIGAQKCGTDALYDALRQHPDIFMSAEKEPSFFIMDGALPDFRIPSVGYLRRLVPDLRDYQNLFSEAVGQQAIGEASAIYLSSYFPERTAWRISQRLPHARLIALVRQPADRAYSAFNFYRARGLEPLEEMRAALADEPRRISEKEFPDIRHRMNGCYYSNLKPYFEHFPKEQIMVVLHDEWTAEPKRVLGQICRFLQVRDELPMTVRRLNVTTRYKSNVLRRYFISPRKWQQLLRGYLPDFLNSGLEAWNKLPVPPMSSELRGELTADYRDEINRLEELIGRDLSHWLEGGVKNGLIESLAE